MILKELMLTGALFLLALFWSLLPAPLFNSPVSDLLYAADSTLLGARIAADQQWRFPETDQIPDKFETALLAFEDKRFYHHPGIDPLAIARAMKLNLLQGDVVSGGSTLTMQLVRLQRAGKPRILTEKLIELLLALRIECSFTKKEILALYASHAPFGGNVVGLDAASWRYFARHPHQLSWAESTLLAILPNSPALIHPGRNRAALQQKRDRLLTKLYQRGILDEESYQLALEESLPEKPIPLPNEAPHLLETLRLQGHTRRIATTLNSTLQRQAVGLLNQYASSNLHNHIHNIAALIADIETGEIIAYVGNSSLADDRVVGRSVDMIRAPRSTGSILKPLLYSAMLQEGILLPATLVPDIPLYLNGFSPNNYDKTFRGAVPANRAIETSLNVPLVNMLLQYEYGRFYQLLQRMGLTTLHRSADHYGVSLILGGAEGTLLDMSGIYASMARVLNNQGAYRRADLRPLRATPNRVEQDVQLAKQADETDPNPLMRRASLWFTVEAMSNLTRPEEESDWAHFHGMKRVAWKTGTSFGSRDAWAIGFTPRHVVGVWVGNASGEGRAGMTGVATAAPVLFDLFSLLPATSWFERPDEELIQLPICRQSGHKAHPYCTPVDTLYIPRTGLNSDPCPYHRRIFLDATASYRVNPGCYPAHQMEIRGWFILPPQISAYYRATHGTYQPLPPFMEGCQSEGEGDIGFIYPTHNAQIYLPRGFAETREKLVLKAAHTHAGATLYWHIGNQYLGATTETHQMAFEAEPGNYILSLIDEAGQTRKIQFAVLSR